MDEPYEEAVTGTPVISTVRSIDHPLSPQPQGVIAMDATLEALEAILEAVTIPREGTLFLTHDSGALLALTGRELAPAWLEQVTGLDQSLQTSSYSQLDDREMFIYTTGIPRVGWRLHWLVPRATFMAALTPMRSHTVVAGLLLAAMSALVFTIASVTHRRKVAALASCYLDALAQQRMTQDIFAPDDEFYALNAAFNRAVWQMRQAEEGSRRDEDDYRELINTAPVGIFQATRERYFVRTNERFAQMLGYPTADDALREVTRVSEDIYVDAEDRDKLLVALQEEGGVRDYQVQFRRRSGRRTWVSISAQAWVDEEGDIHHIAGFVDDICGQVRARRRLEEWANIPTV